MARSESTLALAAILLTALAGWILLRPHPAAAPANRFLLFAHLRHHPRQIIVVSVSWLLGICLFMTITKIGSFRSSYTSLGFAYLGCLLFDSGLSAPGLEFYHDDFRMIADPLNFENPGCLCEIAQAGEPIIARIEVGRLFGEMGTDTSQVSATIFIGRGDHCLLEHLHCGGVEFSFRGY